MSAEMLEDLLWKLKDFCLGQRYCDKCPLWNKRGYGCAISDVSPNNWEIKRIAEALSNTCLESTETKEN